MTAVRVPVLPDVLVLDTCVLISGVLRSVLLGMARTGRVVPVWSAVIGDEWRRTAARLWQLPADDVAQQWHDMQDDFPDADVGDVSAYKAGLQRSDPKDWHVIAAGRVAMERYPGAVVAIITRNIRDFHRAELRQLGLYLFDPDQLLSRYWLHDAGHVRARLEALSDSSGLTGQDPGAMEAMLKRERLFRLNRLTQGYP